MNKAAANEMDRVGVSGAGCFLMAASRNSPFVCGSLVCGFEWDLPACVEDLRRGDDMFRECWSGLVRIVLSGSAIELVF